MPRFITILIGILIFTTISAVVLALFAFEENRQINANIEHLGEEFYKNRVTLFAVPVTHEGGEEFEKLDRFKWDEIRTEMLKYRKEIEELEKRPLQWDLTTIGLFSASFIAIMIYSPALWVAEFRFGNEFEKFLFNALVGVMLLVGTVVEVYAYIMTKANYNSITAKALPVVQKVGQIHMTKGIHYCYYGLEEFSAAVDHDGHSALRRNTHAHMDKVAAAASYCHPEILDVLGMICSVLSVIVHILLFARTNRLGKSQLELLHEIEAVENTVDPVGDSSDEDVDLHRSFANTKGRVENDGKVRRKLMLPDRNPKNAFYAEDDDEKYNEKAETMMETLMDAEQLKELRQVYLSNYYKLKQSASPVLKNDEN